MQSRNDISDKLIHFTSGENYNDAYNRLRKIINDGHLIANGTKIKGGYKCVCFTEAPLVSLQGGLVNPNAYSRYSPFGILFEKKWIYKQGGRPVFYQSDEEFQLLPESLRWRHMRYEPDDIDFSWEREWRIHCEHLVFSPENAVIILPDKRFADRLIFKHNEEQDYKVLQYSVIMSALLAEQYREDFKWSISLLNENTI